MSFIIHYLILFLKIIQMIIFLEVLMSWFPKLKQGSFYAFIFEITTPLYQLARKLPHRFGIIDITPIIVILGLDILMFLILSL